MMDSEPIISIENLYKKFERVSLDVHLFNDLSFSIREKEFVAIVGEGGTGKTTLVNIVAGLEMPSEGKVIVLGHDLSRISDNKISKLRLENVGIVFQTSSLISDLTVFENIQLPMMMREKSISDQNVRVEELLNFFGISNKAMLFSNELSLGERKRVEIARALALDPPILIMDEPLTNLDSPTINTFIPFLRGLKFLRDRTVIVTTNNLKVAKMANKEIILKKPRLLPKVI